MKINEIFYSIEGEGIRAGVPCVFIRLQYCNLNCLYCDTRYACEGFDFKELTLDEVMQEVKKYGCKNVTVTGGEPLLDPQMFNLLERLSIEGFYVNVETNGSKFPLLGLKNVFYTIDYKTYSSGMSSKMNLDAFKLLTENDVIKFVVGDQKDLEQALNFVKENDFKSHIFVSPIFGKIEPCEIAEFIKLHHLDDWRLQLQIHKFIWPPEKRGV